MLSPEDTSNPTTSHAIFAVKHHESVRHKLASQDADLSNANSCPLRDYVFASRSKGIGRNWPFSSRSLELCLKHGIDELLPPFEAPDSVRGQYLTAVTDTNQTTVNDEGVRETEDVTNLNETEEANFYIQTPENIKLNSPPYSHPSILETVDKFQSSLTEGENKKSVPVEIRSFGLSRTSKLNYNGADREGILTEAAHVELESNSSPASGLNCSVKVDRTSVVHSERIHGTGESKCRLIVKFCGVSESKRREEDSAHSLTVVDLMASKICPVCKVFSSTSNTTLNAHIDQCLSHESTVKKRLVTNLTKPHRIKPRKKRLIGDIIATTPRCSLAELEMGNRLIVGPDAASPAPDADAQTESGRPPRGSADVCASNCDTVQKFSKLRHRSSTATRADRKMRKHKCFPDTKKRLSTSPFSSRDEKPFGKKFCSMSMNNQTLDTSYEKEEEAQKEKSLSELLKAQDMAKGTQPSGYLRQGVRPPSRCSRKRSEKDFKETRENGLGSFPVQNRVMGFSRRSEHRAAAAKLCHLNLSGEGLSGDVCSADTFATPQSKRVKTDACPSDHSALQKARRVSFSMRSSLPSKSYVGMTVTKSVQDEPTHEMSQKLEIGGHERGKTLHKIKSFKNARLRNMRQMHRSLQVTGMASETDAYFNKSWERQEGLTMLASSSLDCSPDNIEAGSEGSRQILSRHTMTKSDLRPSRSNVEHIVISGGGTDVEFSAGKLERETYKEVRTLDSESLRNSRDLSYDLMHSLGHTNAVTQNETVMWPHVIADNILECKEMSFDVESEGITSQTEDLETRTEGDRISESQKLAPDDGPELCLPSFEEMGFELLRRNSFLVASHQSSRDVVQPKYPAASPQSSVSADAVNLRSVDHDKLSESGSDLSVVVCDEDPTCTLPTTYSTGAAEGFHKRDSINMEMRMPTSNSMMNTSGDPHGLRESIQLRHVSKFLRRDLNASRNAFCHREDVNSSAHLHHNRADAFNGCSNSQFGGSSFESLLGSYERTSDDVRGFSSRSNSGIARQSTPARRESAPSAVLRLMGKNLMVLNNEEGDAPQVRMVPQGSMTEQTNANCLPRTLAGFSNGSIVDQTTVCFWQPSGTSSSFSGRPVGCKDQDGYIADQTPTPGQGERGNFVESAGLYSWASKFDSLDQYQNERGSLSTPSAFLLNAERIQVPDPTYQWTSPAVASQAAYYSEAANILDDHLPERGPRMHDGPRGSHGSQWRGPCRAKINFLSLTGATADSTPQPGTDPERSDGVPQSHFMLTSGGHRSSPLFTSPVL